MFSIGSLWLLGGGWIFQGPRGGREQGDQLGGHCDHPGERGNGLNALGHSLEGFTVESGTENVRAQTTSHMHPHTQAHI